MSYDRLSLQIQPILHALFWPLVCVAYVIMSVRPGRTPTRPAYCDHFVDMGYGLSALQIEATALLT